MSTGNDINCPPDVSVPSHDLGEPTVISQDGDCRCLLLGETNPLLSEGPSWLPSHNRVDLEIFSYLI